MSAATTDAITFQVDRRPVLFFSRINTTYALDFSVHEDYRKTNASDKTQDGLYKMLTERIDPIYDAGFRRFMLANPAGTTLVNGSNYAFSYFTSNSWTGMEFNSRVILSTDTILESTYYLKPWTDTGKTPKAPESGSIGGGFTYIPHHVENDPIDETATPANRQASYAKWMREWIEEKGDVEFIPYAGIQVPYDAAGNLDYGILANARRKGNPPFSRYLSRFPMFNAKNTEHQTYFKNQVLPWKYQVGAQGIGFDTGGLMWDAPPKGVSGDNVKFFFDLGLKPYGEAVPLLKNTETNLYYPYDDARYESQPYVGLYYGYDRAAIYILSLLVSEDYESRLDYLSPGNVVIGRGGGTGFIKKIKQSGGRYYLDIEIPQEDFATWRSTATTELYAFAYIEDPDDGDDEGGEESTPVTIGIDDAESSAILNKSGFWDNRNWDGITWNAVNQEVHVLMSYFTCKENGITLGAMKDIALEMYKKGYVVGAAGLMLRESDKPAAFGASGSEKWVLAEYLAGLPNNASITFEAGVTGPFPS